MNNPLIPPLPDAGPPSRAQDGSFPGSVYTSGTWTIVNGQVVHLQPLGGFTFPQVDAHPAPIE